MRYRGKRSAAAICAVLVVGLFYSLRSPPADTFNSDLGIPRHLRQARKAKVAEAFQHAWDGYSRDCFGADTLHPVSHSCENDFGGWGATAIDSLSTAIILGKEDVVIQILRFIATLDFTVVKVGTKILVFEVVIRHFAGMISAWDLLNGPFSHMAKDRHLRRTLLNQTINLGNVLSCAFNTSSGIPSDWVDPATCGADLGAMNSIAAAGTVILEFARLSDITGDPKYARLARKAESHLLKPQPASGEPYPGLLGSHASLITGVLTDDEGSWGAFADSFYEYLLKAYLYNSDIYADYLERWLAAADSTIKYIGSHPHGRPDLTLLPSWDGSLLDYRMESLSWFAGGNFILGGMVTSNETLINYGLAIADTAHEMYNMTTTGLGGEFVSWRVARCDYEADEACNPAKSVWTADASFRLRPEVLETWYYAYRATGDEKYREWSWAAFEAINRYCRTEAGFSGINDVNDPQGGGKNDIQESFVFAEVMKYVYLVFLEVKDKHAPFHVQDSRGRLKNTWVYNTEAHPMRVAGPPR